MEMERITLARYSFLTTEHNQIYDDLITNVQAIKAKIDEFTQRIEEMEI
jgi:hypothetical protein